MVSSSDTSSAEEGNNFMLTPSHPSAESNRPLFISLLVSVEELLWEIKQALQLKHNKLAQHWEGSQGSMLCDKAIIIWHTGARSIPFFFKTLLSAEYMSSEYYLAESSEKAFYCTPVHPVFISQCAVIVLVLFLSAHVSFSFFFYKGMCFILHYRSWHLARSLVLSPPIFLVEFDVFADRNAY